MRVVVQACESILHWIERVHGEQRHIAKDFNYHLLRTAADGLTTALRSNSPIDTESQALVAALQRIS